METAEHITTCVGFFWGGGGVFSEFQLLLFYFVVLGLAGFSLQFTIFSLKKKPQKEVYPNLFIDFVQG